MIAPQPPLKTSIGKLLFNSWAAEYALNIKPACADRAFLNSALSWAKPQAYYATLFSMRARLAIDGVNIANPHTIEKLMIEWAKQGKFGPATQRHPFDRLFACRIGSTPADSAIDAALQHVELSAQVHAFALLSETYILNRWGVDQYMTLVESLPGYLKNGFVGARATLLLADE